ncbi:MAG: hypothetical protein NT133_16945 [Alphaproteobacteria bacterium]|nr:hypothetical protein [Alphaproteobacteria bacterium]
MNPAPTPPAPHTHAELAALMLRVVVGLVGAMGKLLWRHPRYEHGPAVWNYLVGGARRFGRVLARIAAGDIFRARKSRAGAPRKARARPRLVFPRNKDWVGALGWEIRVCNAQIVWVLNQPGVAEIVANSTQAQRVLRPMFHILGIEHPSVPPLPHRPRKPRPKKVSTKPKRLTRKEREAILWYPNSEGKPMKLLPRRLPRD